MWPKKNKGDWYHSTLPSCTRPTQQRKDKTRISSYKKNRKNWFSPDQTEKKMAEHTKARVSNVILEITLIKDIQKKLKISTLKLLFANVDVRV